MEVTKKAKRDKKNPKGSQNTKSKTYQASTSGEACENLLHQLDTNTTGNLINKSTYLPPLRR